MKRNWKWSGLLIGALAVLAVGAVSGAAKAAQPDVPVAQQMDAGASRMDADGGMPPMQGMLRGSLP